MSGTGTAVYGVFFDEVEAQAAEELLEVTFSSICSPVAQGTEML
jgi:4-diphosphocytidyl-2C-methyl-D-erythritol kinase